MKKIMLALGLMASATLAQAATYNIDTRGAHAFVQFKIKHLGYSWLLGRFNTFDGQFEYDASAPEKSSVFVEIDTASIDSNHAERDKHLKGSDFLNVSKFPKSTFKSTGFEATGESGGIISGQFTLHGVTKDISFPVSVIGEGSDPWGGYRAGFAGTTTLKLADYGIDYNLGPASTHVDIELHIEGVRR
ncbi:YceI family protein [Endozoicomonas ascidiicola]|uniref:YceI family protein n=1 Tax=Endozoicomonas ascidiicola TaxID=1698521 RepID=UPI00082C7FE3|nr:YceI family protein [Endozoicomonas ascidiicola]